MCESASATVAGVAEDSTRCDDAGFSSVAGVAVRRCGMSLTGNGAGDKA